MTAQFESSGTVKNALNSSDQNLPLVAIGVMVFQTFINIVGNAVRV